MDTSPTARFAQLLQLRAAAVTSMSSAEDAWPAFYEFAEAAREMIPKLAEDFEDHQSATNRLLDERDKALQEVQLLQHEKEQWVDGTLALASERDEARQELADLKASLEALAARYEQVLLRDPKNPNG